MRRSWFAFALIFLLVLAMHAAPAYAQGSASTSLSGTIVDTSGGVLPGAEVTIKNKATGEVYSAVSGPNGGWTVPAVSAGTYGVTISLMGFKTAQLNEIVINAAVPAVIDKTVLELGKLEETVVVEASTQIVQTQTSAIASTISSKQITNLPGGRDAFSVIMLIPGVASATSGRYGAVNGLPQSSVNITLDGMNIQDNYLKTTDGMFTRVSPRIDSVEEVTIGTAAQGADNAGQGSVQVRFITRMGTNQFRGSTYYYFQREWMNTNGWFNLHRDVQADGTPTPKSRVAVYQPGFRVGGPIRKDKAFFFVNYEESRSPGTYKLGTNIFSPTSEQGIFRYGTNPPATCSVPVAGCVPLMYLAAQKGYTATIDPTVARILANIRAATATTGVVADRASDPLAQDYTWQFPTRGLTKYPTVRLDYNVTSQHRLTASVTQNHLISDPDTLNGYYRNFPGFATQGMQDSYRWTGQISVRSTLTPNMVNEVRLGGTGGSTFFNPELNAGMFSGQTPDMNGYAVAVSAFKSATNPYSSSANSSREGSTRVFEDTLSWIKGSHSISMGTSYTQADIWLANQQHVPTIGFGIVTGDPADAMFTAANFPGTFSSTNQSDAKALYAVLTGRISSIGRNARIAEDGINYVILGPSMQQGRLRQLDFFFQDSWKVKPSITINAGLRYALQFPFYALNNSYSTATQADIFGVSGVGTDFVPGSTVTNLGNLFKPNTLQGTAPTYQMLTASNYGYNVDKNNLAPSIGVAWKLPQSKGILGKITGSDAVIRGGFNIAYQRGGMSDFTGVYGSNPGVSIDATRNLTNGNLGTPPVLLGSSDLGAPSTTNLTRAYPMPIPTASSSVYVFDPNIQVPYSTSFTIGMQRALGKSMAIEARFIHTGSHGSWSSYNYNEVNIIENGFLDEFKLAQANLVANINAGKGNTFAYTGAAGTSPLPIFLAYFNGKPASDKDNTTKYTGSGWTTSSYLTNLFGLNPNPQSLSSSLRSNATYKANALTAGLASNFFVVNPDVNNANLTTNGSDTRYNGIQLVFNRRFSGGLNLQANYSYGMGYQFNRYGFHKPLVETEQNYNNSNSNATGNIRHVFSANWVYELPFGQGKRFGNGAGRNFNRLIGNWSWMGTARVQSGRLVDLGNVRVIGMTADEVRDMLQMRFTTDPANQYRTLIYDWPQDVIDNTIKAYTFNALGYTSGAPENRYFAPANGPGCIESTSGYGDCGVRSLIVSGPPIVRFDMSIGKQIMVTGRINIEFQVQVFNVFNNLNLSPVSGIGSSTVSGYQVGSAVDQSRTMQLALRINF